MAVRYGAVRGPRGSSITTGITTDTIVAIAATVTAVAVLAVATYGSDAQAQSLVREAKIGFLHDKQQENREHGSRFERALRRINVKIAYESVYGE